jgi:hypothetical protein
MESKASKTKTSTSTSATVVSGGNKIVEKKLNNQVVELGPQTTASVKKGGAKKVEVEAVAEVKEAVQPTLQKGKGKGASKTPVPVPVQAQAQVQVQVQEQAPAPVQAGGTKKSKVSSIKTVVSAELEAEPEAQSKLRYFKLFYNNEICGRYCGKKPKQAANKAFSSIVKDMKKDGVTVTTDSKLEVPFTIKECTRNSKHKEYKYIGRRHLLKEPVKVSIENGDGSVKEIVYKFHNQLQKAPKE